MQIVDVIEIVFIGIVALVGIGSIAWLLISEKRKNREN